MRSRAMTHRDPLYRRHRFPAEVIAHAVWLYFRFPLSLRMVEDILAAVASSSRTRRSGSGRRNLAGTSPTISGGARPESSVTSGTSTRSSSRCAGRNTGSGGLSTRMGSYWMLSFRAAENSHQPTRRRERIMRRFKSRRQERLTILDTSLVSLWFQRRFAFSEG